MIRRVTIRNFKRFEEQTFELADSVVLAGPNNAGKSTLLQAIATWKMGINLWTARRGVGSTSKAVKRSGISITRAELTATPLREMNLLWRGRRVARTAQEGTQPGVPRLIEIVLEGGGTGGRGVTGRAGGHGSADGQGGAGDSGNDPEVVDRPWKCGLEFHYANPEMVYVRPQGAKQLDRESIRRFPPKQAADLEVVHVSPLAGVQRDEPRLDKGMQELLVGQGQAGGTLRNLLLEAAEKESGVWDDLVEHIRNLFGIGLRKPVYSPAQPYILCEYDEPTGYDEPRGSGRPLDLANAGSGTLQVILLLAFLYARPASVMLLDGPDVHQHVVLQKQVYGLLRKVAQERGAQIVVATHSKVVLDATAPERVLNFCGNGYRALTTSTDVRSARERTVTAQAVAGQAMTERVAS